MTYVNRTLLSDTSKSFKENLLTALNLEYEPRFKEPLKLEDFEVQSLETNQTDKVNKGNTSLKLWFANRYLLGNKTFYYQRRNVSRLGYTVENGVLYLGLHKTPILLNDGSNDLVTIHRNVVTVVNQLLGLQTYDKAVLADDFVDAGMGNEVLLVIDSIDTLGNNYRGYTVKGRIVNNPFWVCDMNPLGELSDLITEFKLDILEATLNYFAVKQTVPAFTNPTFLLAPNITANSFVTYDSDYFFKSKVDDVFTYLPGYRYIYNPKVLSLMFKDSERN